MASSTFSRAAELPRNAENIFEGFGWLLDTHRDLPHIGSLDDDLHRGMCRPIRVDLQYLPMSSEWMLVTPDRSRTLRLDPAHKFVTEEQMRDLILQSMVTTGKTPFDSDGRMPTSLVRDPRKKIYKLKSFRQMVVMHQQRLGIYAPR